MQEFQPIPGLAGRLFGGAADPAGLRRGGAMPPLEEVRCPRCDSANTKFCYYNNYNLSQPRHYCKTCRRYWTKGGLLRNVPVGGGCRKPKRPAVADVDKSAGAHRDAKNPRPGCTGGSSPAAAAVASAAASASNTVGAGAAAVAHSIGGSTTTTGVRPSTFRPDPLPLPPPAPMFADQAAGLASLFAPPPQLPALSFSAQPKAEEDAAPAHPLTVEQPSPASTTADNMAPFSVRPPATDWPSSAVDATGIFDLAGDASSYWNLASWTDPDGTIYLP